MDDLRRAREAVKRDEKRVKTILLALKLMLKADQGKLDLVIDVLKSRRK